MRQVIEWDTLFIYNNMNKSAKIALLLVCILISSCGSYKLSTTSVAYQSVRTVHSQPTATAPIPDDAKIAVAYTISKEGILTAVVYNRSDEIMTIDQTKSFFVNSNGVSTSYYDPTVRTTSKTDISSTTGGGSVNLGAIAGAFGIGGVVGQIASGINLGGSETTGASVTNTTYIADLPQVSIAPHSNGAMSKNFHIFNIGSEWIKEGNTSSPSLTEEQSYCKFSVCISYSFDEGKSFDKIVTNFYANSKIIIPVEKTGNVNDALRKIYISKPDALNEYWWLLKFNSNVSTGYNERVQGVLYDYK